AQALGTQAAQVHQSFNKRFWYEQGGYLYDVVDGAQGDDAACRPNLRARSEGCGRAAEKLQASFNARFWNAASGCLYDVIDGESGDDPALRPNQLLAISLPHAVLDPARWSNVVARVEEKLLTPVGLRSLSPDDPEYKPKYFGDLRARDLAYHQGTVWAWLIGPFVDAWLRVRPGAEEEAAAFLRGFSAPMERGCVGTIGEIFDGSAPFVGRGCVAQAWSVAEVLRCLAKVARATP
ncbi:MAG TPA: amylo-alpha-1,6-glucosidase, partial [Polyangiaceae bacterium]